MTSRHHARESKNPAQKRPPKKRARKSSSASASGAHADLGRGGRADKDGHERAAESVRKPKVSHAQFRQFDLSDEMSADIDALGWDAPTPVQARTIGSILKRRDVVAMAQTGTGKTGAFAVPIIELLRRDPHDGAIGPSAVVLVPTRELAQQVDDQFRALSRSAPLPIVTVIGGAPMRPQVRALRDAMIVIATPGRLIDHLERHNVDFADVDILVLDEADRMFDMGFEPQVRRLLRVVPRDAQVLLFSATLDDNLTDLANRTLHDPVRVEIGPKKTPPPKIEQRVYMMVRGSKFAAIRAHVERFPGKVLIFSNTKIGADRVTEMLLSAGFAVRPLHADRTQKQRDAALRAFRAGNVRILVATDVASRGLDIDDIQLVINLDFPKVADDYVHRIGRTARAEAEGAAISFIEPGDLTVLTEVEKLIGKRIDRIDENGKVLAHEPAKPDRKKKRKPEFKPSSRFTFG